MGVDFVLLTEGTAVDEVFHEGGETWPPKIMFKDSLGVEDTHVTHGGERVDGVEEREEQADGGTYICPLK